MRVQFRLTQRPCDYGYPGVEVPIGPIEEWEVELLDMSPRFTPEPEMLVLGQLETAWEAIAEQRSMPSGLVETWTGGLSAKRWSIMHDGANHLLWVLELTATLVGYDRPKVVPFPKRVWQEVPV